MVFHLNAGGNTSATQDMFKGSLTLDGHKETGISAQF